MNLLLATKKIFTIAFLVIFCGLFWHVGSAEGAALSLESKGMAWIPGDTFSIHFYLDTEGQSINAIEGSLFFPANSLEPVQIQNANSIINFWLLPPKISQLNSIPFSGVIPGGYHSKKGLIFSVMVKVKTPGTAAIEIKNPRVLLNDGKGTPATIKVSSFQSALLKPNPDLKLRDALASLYDTTQDHTPPEDFTPTISKNKDMFSNKWFLVFNAVDKDSEISSYQVCEGSQTDCVTAQSPFVLKNQKLDKQIFVKAFDGNNNVRVVALPPQPMTWQQYLIMVMGLGLVILLLCGAFLLISQKMMRPRSYRLK